MSVLIIMAAPPPYYEKLINEKPPKSPNKPLKLRIQQMLSGGSSRSGSSSPNSPSSPTRSPIGQDNRKAHSFEEARKSFKLVNVLFILL